MTLVQIRATRRPTPEAVTNHFLIRSRRVGIIRRRLSVLIWPLMPYQADSSALASC